MIPIYEYHGWATIHETTLESDTGNLDKIINNIQSYISELEWSNGLLKVYPANGTYQLSIGGYLNRKTFEAEEIMKLFHFIAQQAPGSYGLLYIRDDEDIDGRDNEFIVFVLARGSIQQKQDVFLTPFVPTVEDNE